MQSGDLAWDKFEEMEVDDIRTYETGGIKSLVIEIMFERITNVMIEEPDCLRDIRACDGCHRAQCRRYVGSPCGF